ncbi:ABC transporter permease subunit [Natronorubrum daqingense]|uniref:ABC-2 type transport system permease protein n=1 Tax=Natronorubrum daqingense TaxID=588898 RepID=A0A1N7FTY9_9EURY|nr:ABC transporter permease subunit [Natronorubrum daqingense]APX97428.1 hypothetical protein BB347_12860 [Natronorubrum daqingense]SIS03832.1 ABC-2 type transport system permease protein [Natronorubrum daqingense]
MSWVTIARTEFETTKESRAVRWLLWLLAGACVLAGYLFPEVTGGSITTREFAGFSFLTESINYLLALIGVVLGYGAIVEERTSGKLTLLLSLPYSRRDLVVGKVVGRSLVFATALVAALAVAGALVVYPFGSLSLGWYIAFVVVTVCYGVIFTGLAVSISMLTSSKHVATIGAFGSYGLFVAIWGTVESSLEYGLETIGMIEGGLPDALAFVFSLNPVRLYTRIVDGLIAGGSGTTAGSDAWYFSEWLALVAFVAWLVVPLTLSYLWFSTTDL